MSPKAKNHLLQHHTQKPKKYKKHSINQKCHTISPHHKQVMKYKFIFKFNDTSV